MAPPMPGGSVPGASGVSGTIFAAYPRQVLGPPLWSGDVVGLDKLPVPKVAELAALFTWF